MNTQSRFSDGPKEEIRTRINIVDLVGRYVKLKGAGQSWKGLCPFHKEKTPSFIVNPSRGTYHCFGCAKGGDIFSFLQEIEGLDFKDALKQLADEADVKLETPDAGAAQTHSNFPAKPEMLAIHDEAAKFFYNQMKKNAVAIEYFKSRGLKGETAREFLLGYAPPGWNNLTDYLKPKGITPQALVACGLALKKAEGSAPYDRFRDRIVFTLFDITGKPIGFAARTLKADEQPKYLNSPETPIYRKSSVLYGLHKARTAIKDENAIIIVEGYMDFLALFQAGVRNVVATSGTAMTPDHGQIIRRFTNRVFLVFDGDSAGVVAAERGVMVLAPFNFEVRVLILPDDEDPDEFVKARGPEAFRALLAEKSVPGFTFLLGRLERRHGANTPQAKAVVVDELVPFFSAVTDTIVRGEYVKECAERLGINEQLILAKIKPARHEEKGTPTADKPQTLYTGTVEENFLRILLTKPELIGRAKQLINPEALTDLNNSKLYSSIIKTYERDQGQNPLVDALSEPDSKKLAAALLAKQGPLEKLDVDLSDLVVLLQRAFLKRQQKEITQQLRRNPATRDALLARLKEISEAIAGLGTST